MEIIYTVQHKYKLQQYLTLYQTTRVSKRGSESIFDHALCETNSTQSISSADRRSTCTMELAYKQPTAAIWPLHFVNKFKPIFSIDRESLRLPSSQRDRRLKSQMSRGIVFSWQLLEQDHSNISLDLALVKWMLPCAD